MGKKAMTRVWTSILAVSMVLGLVNLPVNLPTAMAEPGDTGTVRTRTVNLQIDGDIAGITDPSVPTAVAQAWSGSKVYFGKYNNNPLLFRVLDAKTTDYSADGTTKTMLLDSNTLFSARAFLTGQADVSWENSDIKTWMQGTGTGQLLNQFDQIERAAMVASNKSARSSTDGPIFSNGAFVPLEDDTVFALDVAEARNTAYGYSQVDRDGTNQIVNRIKELGGNAQWWWTRSTLKSGGKDYASFVSAGGIISNAAQTNAMGVSPAMNLDLSAILFASASGQNKNASFHITADAGDNDIWNLTLAGGKGFAATLDGDAVTEGEEIRVTIADLGTTLDGAAVSAGYYSQLSAMLIDKSGTVVAYGKISDEVTAGNVSFAVPAGIARERYTLKVFAEKVNSSDSNNVTDYASNMVSFGLDFAQAKNINLQINGAIRGITNPSAPINEQAWSGSKVYFGKYNNNPVLFRVLDANTTDYSADGTTQTMLLESDLLFPTIKFDVGQTDNGWVDSDIKAWMQGTDSGRFMRQFSAMERTAIIASNKAAPSATDGTIVSGTFCALVDDTVFALDVVELKNTSYGYSNIETPVANRIKQLGGNVQWWWTRSPLTFKGTDYVRFVNTDGKIGNASVTTGHQMAVSPAMNLNVSAILYASASDVTQTTALTAVGTDLVAANTWKLTLLDSSKTVGIQENQFAFKVGTRVTVPYTYAGSDISQLSVMITNTERTDPAAEVLYYGKLVTVSGAEGSGSATFVLPSLLPEGHKVYLLAEDINGGNLTNYASEPVELDIVASENNTMEYTTRGTIYQSLDFGDYPVDFDGGAVIDGVEYEEGTTIDSTGDYEMIYTESGKNYKRTVALYRLGDLNTDNEINSVDLVVMKKFFANARELSLSGDKSADITLDNRIDEQDFQKLVQNLLNDSAFPITGYTPDDMDALVDFTVEVESGRDIRVLQLTDTQIIESEQQRYDDRLGVGSSAYEQWLSTKKDVMYRNCVRYTIETYDPDFIIVTGDLVFGEFDDSGDALFEFISYMDSFKKPWAPIFGNHENESRKGVDWQCEQLENSEYCLFKQRTLTGNGNYTVGLKQDGTYKRVFFMLDSNGCSAMSDESYANGHSKKTIGFGADQIEWYTDLSEKMRYAQPSVKLSAAFHIQLNKFTEAYAKYGFTNSDTANNPVDIGAKTNKESTDFGYLGRDLKGPWDKDDTVWYSLKTAGFDSMFVGHEHCNSASVVYKGVRFQYGQKSSAYDRTNYISADGSIVGSYSFYAGIPVVGGTTIPIHQDGSLGTGSILLYME